jgi:hypothetical protein
LKCVKKGINLQKEMSMTTVAEIKNDLHRLIVETEEQEVLLQIRFIFEQMKVRNIEIDWYETLNLAQKKSLEIGLHQLSAGQRIPHAEVRKEINQRLGK